ncbi:tail fiber domain-containing protein [Candidatus Azambacteria bacterium]|nr:tail fiber domain-containing protein [Candidatus Azambacteria bacterium]
MKHLKTLPSSTIFSLLLLFGVIVFSFSGLVRGFVEPTMSPPDGNVSEPINTGSSTQTKTGDLILNGSVKIGTATIQALTIGGTKVCLADGTNCFVGATVWTRTKPNLYPSTLTDNVGIGTTTPFGGLMIGDGGQTNGRDIILSSTGTDPGDLVFFKNSITTSPGTELARISADPNGGSKLNFSTGTNTDVQMVLDGGNVGIGTTTPEFRLSLDNDGGIIAKGTHNSGVDLSAAGSGTRFIWYPKKAAFRAGYVDGSQWDDQNIGDYSTAMGRSTTASGKYSTVMGVATTASGINSTAMGSSTTASGNSSIAMGISTTASGINSTAMGHSLNVSNTGSFGINTRQDFTKQTVSDPYSFNVYYGGIGSERLFRLTSDGNMVLDGNVGIGTTSPTIKLAIGDTDTGLDWVSDGVLTVKTNNAEQMRINSSGNVGIGTTAPDVKLVVNSGSLSANTRFESTLNTLVTVYTSNSSGIPGLSINSPNRDWRLEGNRSALGHFNISDCSAGCAQRLVIDTSGNVGIGTPTPEFRLSLDNDGGIIAKGIYGSGVDLSAPGKGPRFIWYPKKAAFRAGGLEVGSIDYWDDKNIGDYSIAMGRSNKASGENSTSIGYITRASGSSSTAMGYNTTASGNTSTAMGYRIDVSGTHSFGINTRESITAPDVSDPYSFNVYYGKLNDEKSFRLQSDGNAVIYNDSGSAIWSTGTGSTIRLKENVYSIDNALDKVLKLRGVYFDWKPGHVNAWTNKTKDIGFIAEEVGKILPEIVSYEKNGVDAVSLDYSKLGPVLVEAVKEQQKQIEELTKKNTDYETRLKKLEGTIH